MHRSTMGCSQLVTKLMRNLAATVMTGMAGDQLRAAVLILDRWTRACAPLAGRCSRPR